MFLANGYKINGEGKVCGIDYIFGLELVKRNGTFKTQTAIDYARSGSGEDGLSYFDRLLRALLENPQIKVVHVVEGARCDGQSSMVYGYIVANS